MRLRFAYDSDGIDVDLPDANLGPVLTMRPAPPLTDVAGAAHVALRQPLDAAPLAKLARGRRNACIVVSDATRPVPYRALLPPLLDELAAGGIARHDVLLLVATGLHRRSTADERVQMFGREVVDSVRIEDHVARDEASHGSLGATPRGVPVIVDRRYLDADLKIVTGQVSPHLAAGFGGGRKAICPGICGVETIRRWHALQYDAFDRAALGILEGNPLHEEAVAAAAMAGADFALNAVTDAQRRPVALFAGDLGAAFAAAVAAYEKMAVIQLERPADIAVTCGGYRLDRTWYQCVKGLACGAAAVKRGGTIILAAALREGIGGPEYTQLVFDFPDLKAFQRRLREPGFFVVDEWQLAQVAHMAEHAEIMLFSNGLAPSLQERLPATPVASVEEGVRLALARHGEKATIAAVPNGPYVLPRFARSQDR